MLGNTEKEVFRIWVREVEHHSLTAVQERVVFVITTVYMQQQYRAGLKNTYIRMCMSEKFNIFHHSANVSKITNVLLLISIYFVSYHMKNKLPLIHLSKYVK